MSIRKILIYGLALFGLTGCATVSSTWDWFFEDDEEQIAEAEYEQEVVEEEEPSDEELEGVDEFEDEFEDEVDEEEEVVEEEDDYGDRPDPEQRGAAPVAQRTSIYFDYKSTAVSASGLNMLQQHAAFIRSNPGLNVVLVGHTDSVASDDYNKRLSRQRAESVARVLLQMGVSETRIMIRAAGEESPASPGDTDQAHALNRRVEIIYQQL